jgi:chromosomal replication initiation ATPase DnaA
MEQLPLKVIPKLQYAPERFFIHTGVKVILDALQATLKSHFALSFIQGSPRSGKTHLSLYLSHYLLNQGVQSFIVDGSELTERENNSEFDITKVSAPVLIIDNAEVLLNTFHPGTSGPFVYLVEERRRKGGAIILFSTQSPEELPCDDHIKSRIASGSIYHITQPSDEDMLPLLSELARQRGLALTERKEKYLIQRLGRSIQAIEALLERAVIISELNEHYRIDFSVLNDALRPEQNENCG